MMNRRDFLRFQEVPEEFKRRAKRASADPDLKRRYAGQLGKMLQNGKKWLAEHPGADVKIQFNFQKEVAVIAAISDAINKNFVSANAEGLELLKAMWPWDVETEPTVLMVRGVIDTIIKD